MSTQNHRFPVLRFALCATVATIAVVANAGLLTVKFGSAMEVEINGETQSFDADDTFTPTAIPCVYKMRPANIADGERTYAIKGSDNVQGSNPCWRFPQYGDGNWVRVALDPYPASDTEVVLTAYKTSNFFYVDATHGDDGWDGSTATIPTQEMIDAGGTIHGPKKSLQAAHDAVTGDYPIVFAAPGVYNTGVATNYQSGTSNPCIRRLVATKNYIGFIASEGPTATFIVGAPDSTAANGCGAESVGGVCMLASSSNVPQFLQGFTITGCYSPASQSAASQYGIGFYGKGGYRSYCLDCVISNNYAVSSGSASSYGVVERCRIMENDDNQNTTYYGVFVSCVFAGNKRRMSDSTDQNRALISRSQSYFCTYDLRTGMPPSVGRKRIEDNNSSLRTALVCGLSEKSETTTNATRWCDSRAIDDPGFANAEARDYRLGIDSPAMNASSYVDDLDGTARMLMTSDVDGRMPVLNDGMLRLGAVWNEPNTWYVAQAGGDDSNDGTSPERAKATIKAATALSFSGDVIRVAPGTYGIAEGTQTATTKIAARVVVPEFVTVESTDGAEKTIIVGASATGGQIDNATYGTGTNAVRCVYARDGATIRGFTLTGGRGIGATITSGDGLGAAFYSETALGATIDSCIVSNNIAYRGAIYNGVIRNSRVFGNTAPDRGAAGYGCKWYGSIVDGNIGPYVVYNAVVVENCTVGADNLTISGGANTQAFGWYISQDRAIVNTVVLGGKLYYGGGGKLYCTNCIVKSGDTSWTGIPAGRLYDTIVGSSVQAEVDGSYRPVLGSFAGIDRTGATHSDVLGDRDLYGTPRILNGAIDIGAVEYDWRPAFAQAVSRRLTFTEVSPSVTTNATGGLLLPSSCEIAGTVSEGGKYSFEFDLPGGAVEVFVGDIKVGMLASVGRQAITVNIPDATTEFRIVFVPDLESPCAAVLNRIAVNTGFTIMVL